MLYVSSSHFIIFHNGQRMDEATLATTGNQGTQRTKQSDESGPGSIVHEITTKKFQSSVQRCSWRSVNRSVICFRRNKVMVCHGFLCVLPKQRNDCNKSHELATVFFQPFFNMTTDATLQMIATLSPVHVLPRLHQF